MWEIFLTWTIRKGPYVTIYRELDTVICNKEKAVN